MAVPVNVTPTVTALPDTALKVAVMVDTPDVSLMLAELANRLTVGALSSSAMVTVTLLGTPELALVKLLKATITVSSSSSLVSPTEFTVMVPVVDPAGMLMLTAELV